jgi:hypothetical protein
VAALLIVELAVRVATHSLFIAASPQAEDNFVTDPMVGRVIARQGTSRHPTKGFIITIGEHGIRQNGGTPPRGERPRILVVGDSFAFGDGVSDEHTWPAALEQRSGGRVINAGMIGFGVDQAVLRAEQLIDVYHPDTIVLGFIPHDVLRCEMSYWSGFSKPYFDVAPSGLRFHPAVVPAPTALTPVKRLLAKSMTLDLLFPAFLHWQGPRERQVHRQGREVACELMARLAAFARQHGVRALVVAYPQEPSSAADDVATKDAVLACARAQQLPVLDLFPAFDALPSDERARLFDRHYTIAGNALVADHLATALTALSLPPPAPPPPGADPGVSD